MSTVLITGASRGLGAATARRLDELGWTVLAGYRVLPETRGGRSIRLIALDVTDDVSVAAAADEVADSYGAVDVLVNNAGIAGATVSPEVTGADEMREVFETNVFGPVRVTRAFLPLLRRAERPRLVLVSSGLGSQAHMTGRAWYSSIDALAYPSSKAALNMLATQYAKALPEVLVTVVDPGFTATDLNNHQGTQTVEEGTDAIVAAALDVDGPSGRFLGRGGPVDW